MKTLIVANWKCNPTNQKRSKKLFEAVKKGVGKVKNTELVICPPFVYLSMFSGLTLGAQNVFYKEKGAFTGEISPLMLKDLKVKYVILGHSEVRRYLNETDEIINKKVKMSLEVGLSVILCIGETLEERDRGETENILKKQLNIALEGIPVSKLKNRLSIAYEPIWAISSGDPYKTKELPTAEKVEQIYFYIKSLLAKKYNRNNTKNIRIIYGGSANSKNAETYLCESRMQGLLVGGASLNAEEFVKIVKTVE